MIAGRYSPFADLPPLWTAEDDAAYDASRLRRRPARPTRERTRSIVAPARLSAVVALVVGAGWALAGALYDPSAALDASTRKRDLICAQTGKVFERSTVPEGATFPLTGPGGAATLYPAELCFWTADGRAKREPTRVLLNMYRGVDGPTVCPDCGREVVYANPMPPIELMLKAME
ncbi:MAG: hypothetical protein CMJ31_04950 [Phycisphaerae bacterium]|nr:hypothetical protein [Phycisphaerae bacterium]